MENEKSAKDESENKAQEESEREPVRAKPDEAKSNAEDEEMPQDHVEETNETTEAEEANGDAGDEADAEIGETSGEGDEEAVEEEEEREEGEDEDMADTDDGQAENAEEEEAAMEVGQYENTDFDDEASNTSTASPFKKPGGATNNCDRKRHRSVDSSSNLSESSESSAVSSHVKADRQAYQQQLAFYRTPMVGRETVCIFCLNKCTPDREPKLLTCLHSACAECFKERVALAAGERKAMQCVEDDDVEAIQEEVTVVCPLCKVRNDAKII